MKKILLYLLLFLPAFAFAQGGFTSGGDLAQLGPYPIVKSVNILGAPQSVATWQLRNALPSYIRTIGQQCTVIGVGVGGTDSLYVLVGGIANSNWQPFNATVGSFINNQFAAKQSGGGWVDSLRSTSSRVDYIAFNSLFSIGFLPQPTTKSITNFNIINNNNGMFFNFRTGLNNLTHQLAFKNITDSYVLPYTVLTGAGNTLLTRTDTSALKNKNLTDASNVFPTFSQYVPYTGAVNPLDMGSQSILSTALAITGTSGNGYINLANQTIGSIPTPTGSALNIFAAVGGNFGYKKASGFFTLFTNTGQTADATFNLPGNGGNLMTDANTATVTAKSISGSTNTLTNIPNSALTNNTISGVALGGNLNGLNIGFGLTPNGTNYNGLAAVFLGTDSTVLQTVLNFFPKGDTRWLKPSGSGASLTGVVHTTGNETIGGFKTFSLFPSSPNGYGMGGSNNSFFAPGLLHVNNTPGTVAFTAPTVALGDAANATGMAWVLNASYGLDLHKYSTTPSVIDNIVGSFSNIGDISGFRSLSIAGNGSSLISATNSTAVSTELITATNDRTFAGSNNWTGTNWATTGGTFQHTTGSAVAATLTNANLTGSSIVIQRQYMVTFTMSNRTIANIGVALGGVSVGILTNGVNAIIITAGANNADLTFTPSATTFDGAITNISVKQIQPYFSVGGNNSLYVNSNANALYPASYIGNGINTSLLSAQRSPLGQGTLSTTSGANTVTGVGTNWTNDLNVGETIYAGNEAHVIATIGNSTTITTVDNWTNTLTNVGYTIPPTTPFSVTGRGQTLLTSNVGNGAALVITNIANNSATSGSVQGLSNTISYSNTLASQNVFVNNYNGAITVNAANTQNLTNAGQGVSNAVLGITYASGATGTVTNSSLIWGTNFNNAASGITITNGSLIHFNSFANSGTITNMVGLNIPAFTGGTITNQTSLLLGQVSAPSGNWGIYENLALNNYLGTGWTGINTTTQVGTDKFDVNGKVSFSDGTQGLILGAYTSGGGNGAIYPYGVTPSSSNYAFSASTSLTELNGTTINIRAATTANILIGGVNYVTVNSSGTSFNGGSLLNVATPVSGTDGVNKSYVDAHSLPAGSDGQIVSYYDGGVPLAIGRLSVQNAKTIFTPSTGGTVNVNNNYENIIKPAGALATLIINLPSSPSDGDAINLTFTQAVTAITYTGGTVVGAPTSAAATGQYHLTFDAGSTTWY